MVSHISDHRKWKYLVLVHNIVGRLSAEGVNNWKTKNGHFVHTYEDISFFFFLS